MKKFCRNKGKRAAFLGIALAMAVVLLGGQWLAAGLPEEFSVVEGEGLSFPAGSILRVREQEEPSGVRSVQSLQNGSRQAQLSVLGVFPIKRVNLVAKERQRVLLGGQLFGMKMFTDGVIVVGFHDVETSAGKRNPGIDAGLQAGDIIKKVNGEDIFSNGEISRWVENSRGNTLILTVVRGEEELLCNLSPAFDATVQGYRAGLWARDSTAGIGTLTFTLPGENIFAGLGHGICDADSHVLMPLSDGEMLPVGLAGITKGQRGAAGELRGFFTEEVQWGQLLCNTPVGVFGVWSQIPRGEEIEVAFKQEVKRGEAKIFVAVEGEEPRWYDISIQRVNYNADSMDKNLVLHVTDKDLLAVTGGIVQGMSGAPIVQEGRLVGAVTHVFVNDPTRGYGIFIENMLAEAEKIK